jgi:flagellar protein FlbD
MIVLTKLNGPPFALNSDLIERIEETPDTIVSLVDGKRVLVCEGIEEIIEAVRTHRASIIALANHFERDFVARPGLRLVSPDQEAEPWTP